MYPASSADLATSRYGKGMLNETSNNNDSSIFVLSKNNGHVCTRTFGRRRECPDKAQTFKTNEFLSTRCDHPVISCASQTGLDLIAFVCPAALSLRRKNTTNTKGDHGCRGEGAVQNHRTYGVCVTYPKVLRDVKSATTPTTESVSGGSVAATSETSGKQPEGISVRTGRGLRASIGGNSSIGVDVQVGVTH